MHPLVVLQDRIVRCGQCPRLRDWREEVARTKRRAYREQEYWGKPVPSFGDPAARLLLVGLAPGAHGANRTGRMFTGDKSGDFLYRALHETGFASQPASVSADDGLRLTDCYITAPVRCAPPDNKPLPEEIAACRPYLVRELELLTAVRVVVALGRLGFDNFLAASGLRRAAFAFGHGAENPLPDGRLLIGCYHPSQQNTSTGRLTAPMLRAVFERAREALAATPGGGKG